MSAKENSIRPVSDEQVANDLYRAARSFVPEIRRRARQMCDNGRLDQDLMDQLDRAGLLSIMVPKRWGGAGLGLHETHQVIEILASGDSSTAWVASFFMVHATLLCRFPMSAQERLFQNRCMVRASAVWNPPGKAEPVDGGYRVTGKWGYASGIYHADVVLAPAKIGDMPHWFIIPVEQLKIHDDWDMAAMSATGSPTVSADGVVVPADAAMEIGKIVSATNHGGTTHAEQIYRLPFSAFLMMTPSISVGALSHAVENTRDKLVSSKPYGIARIDRAPARMRWAEAFETLRIIRLLRDTAAADALRRGSAVGAESLDEEAAIGLDTMAVVHGASKAARSLIDGFGTSSYKSDDPLPRIAADLAMISTHVLGYDYDVMMERNARWLLGLGLGTEDASVRL